MNPRGRKPVVLLTGASGYIGSRLRPCLESRDLRLRCLTRRPASLVPGRKTEIVYGDLLEPDSLTHALEGVDVAYYLVHSMESTGDFVEKDRLAARNFAIAACQAGVSRIIYLGGLGAESGLSAHLESRHEVGRILRESGVETLEFQASIIIGSGSLSFEIVRALVEKLPVMVTPRWVRQRAQPISIDDVVAYLVAGLDADSVESTVFEIGGAEEATYQEIMDAYARRRGLRRLMIPVPVLTPRLSGLWLGLVTPAYAAVGRKLVESLRNDTVVSGGRALDTFPIVPVSLEVAIDRALLAEDDEFRRHYWSRRLEDQDFFHEDPEKTARFDVDTLRVRGVGRRFVECLSIRVRASCSEAFDPIRRIGGTRGWYSASALWRLRGWIDTVLGGPGLRRGRQDPESVRVGDTVDFWRVEVVEPDRRLRLRAEMKIPGRAWLDFEVVPGPTGSWIVMTAEFDPCGLAGLAYWYALYPIHRWIFARMLRKIGEVASRGPGVSPAGISPKATGIPESR